MHFLISAESVRSLGTIEGAGNAHLVVGFLHRLDSPDAVGMRRRPALPELPEQVGRPQNEPGGLTLLVFNDLAVRCLWSVARDTGSLKKHRIQNARVAVVAHSGTPRRGGV